MGLRPTLRTTYSYAVLDISRAAYDEIATKLRAAGYNHAFDGETIDMHGIALEPGAPVTCGFTKVIDGVKVKCIKEHGYVAKGDHRHGGFGRPVLDPRDMVEGEQVWLPCEVRAGMFPTEKSVTLHVRSEDDSFLTVKGLIPSEDVRELSRDVEARGLVRGVVADLENGTAAVLFRGEIYAATNPVLVSTPWLEKTRARVDI